MQVSNAETIPVPLACGMHPWMRAYVLVQDHPYMAVSDDNGTFELKNLPADATLKVWHEKIGFINNVKIDGKKAVWKRGRYVVRIDNSATEKHTYTVDPKAFAKK